MGRASLTDQKLLRREQLKALWILAREQKLKVESLLTPPYAGGNAKEFIQALGGLAAAGSKTPREQACLSIARLTENASNGYGDSIVRTVGIALVQSNVNV